MLMILSSCISGTSRIWDGNGSRMLLLPLISEDNRMATNGFWPFTSCNPETPKETDLPFHFPFWVPSESSTWPSLGQMGTLTMNSHIHRDWVREETVMVHIIPAWGVHGHSVHVGSSQKEGGLLRGQNHFYTVQNMFAICVSAPVLSHV